jgi:hypothetical protein
MEISFETYRVESSLFVCAVNEKGVGLLRTNMPVVDNVHA